MRNIASYWWLLQTISWFESITIMQVIDKFPDLRKMPLQLAHRTQLCHHEHLVLLTVRLNPGDEG